jgi:hypothetical protein
MAVAPDAPPPARAGSTRPAGRQRHRCARRYLPWHESPLARDQDGDFAGWLGAVAVATDELLILPSLVLPKGARWWIRCRAIGAVLTFVS